MEAYLCYEGTIGFSDYMNKHEVDPQFYKRVSEHNACGCMGANGEKENISEFLEKELSILNELHAKFTSDILDVNERIANLEKASWDDKPAGTTKERALKAIRDKVANIKAWRIQLAEKVEKWKAEAAKRQEQRKDGKLPEKLYANAEDEMPGNEVPEVKKNKLGEWIKANHSVISVTIGVTTLVLFAVSLNQSLKHSK